MIAAIVTTMVTAILSTVTRSVDWQISVLGNPLYRYIFWHSLLFAIMLAFFYDRRHGYKKSIGIIGYIATRFQKKSHTWKVNATMSMYKEHVQKFHLRTVLLPIAITLFIVYILSAHLLFLSIVTSGSMEPTFKKGDLVLMQNILVKPTIGDIIMFPDPDGLTNGNKPVMVTHRINTITGDTIISTKGDNNPAPDHWKVSKKNILGEAIILNNKPIVLKDAGKYFLMDYRSTGQYNPEFAAISKMIQNIKTMGMMVFFICIVLYLFLSIRDVRPTKRFKSR